LKSRKLKLGVIAVFIIGFFAWFLASPYWKYNEWSDGNYYVIDIMAIGNNELVYKLDNNSSIGRVDNIKRIGSNSKFIISEDTKSQFWILNKEKDDRYLNANEIVEGPYTYEEFQNQLTLKKVGEIEFEKSIE
jgi:hypothetical protein